MSTRSLNIGFGGGINQFSAGSGIYTLDISTNVEQLSLVQYFTRNTQLSYGPPSTLIIESPSSGEDSEEEDLNNQQNTGMNDSSKSNAAQQLSKPQGDQNKEQVHPTFSQVVERLYDPNQFLKFVDSQADLPTGLISQRNSGQCRVGIALTNIEPNQSAKRVVERLDSILRLNSTLNQPVYVQTFVSTYQTSTPTQGSVNTTAQLFKLLTSNSGSSSSSQKNSAIIYFKNGAQTLTVFEQLQQIESRNENSINRQPIKAYLVYDRRLLKNEDWAGVVLRNLPPDCTQEQLTRNFKKDTDAYTIAKADQPISIHGQRCSLLHFKDIEQAEKFCKSWHNYSFNESKFLKAHIHPMSNPTRPKPNLSHHQIFKSQAQRQKSVDEVNNYSGKSFENHGENAKSSQKQAHQTKIDHEKGQNTEHNKSNKEKGDDSREKANVQMIFEHIPQQIPFFSTSVDQDRKQKLQSDWKSQIPLTSLKQEKDQNKPQVNALSLQVEEKIEISQKYDKQINSQKQSNQNQNSQQTNPLIQQNQKIDNGQLEETLPKQQVLNDLKSQVSKERESSQEQFTKELMRDRDFLKQSQDVNKKFLDDLVLKVSQNYDSELLRLKSSQNSNLREPQQEQKDISHLNVTASQVPEKIEDKNRDTQIQLSQDEQEKMFVREKQLRMKEEFLLKNGGQNNINAQISQNKTEEQPKQQRAKSITNINDTKESSQEDNLQQLDKNKKDLIELSSAIVQDQNQEAQNKNQRQTGVTSNERLTVENKKDLLEQKKRELELLRLQKQGFNKNALGTVEKSLTDSKSNGLLSKKIEKEESESDSDEDDDEESSSSDDSDEDESSYEDSEEEHQKGKSKSKENNKKSSNFDKRPGDGRKNARKTIVTSDEEGAISLDEKVQNKKQYKRQKVEQKREKVIRLDENGEQIKKKRGRPSKKDLKERAKAEKAQKKLLKQEIANRKSSQQRGKNLEEGILQFPDKMIIEESKDREANLTAHKITLRLPASSGSSSNQNQFQSHQFHKENQNFSKQSIPNQYKEPLSQEVDLVLNSAEQSHVSQSTLIQLKGMNQQQAFNGSQPKRGRGRPPKQAHSSQMSQGTTFNNFQSQ